MSPAPKDPHQKRSVQMTLGLGNLKLGGELRFAPTDVYLGDDTVLQPDIFWVSADSTRCVLRDDGYWHGAPDLVIEIVSPSSAKYDRGVKYDLYEKYGVREYWLTEPQADYIEVYALADDKFARVGLFGIGESFVSSVLGNQTIEVNALFGE